MHSMPEKNDDIPGEVNAYVPVESKIVARQRRSVARRLGVPTTEPFWRKFVWPGRRCGWQLHVVRKT